jgi:hypothetical protein
MDMETVGLIVAGWVAVALIVAVALGSFLREVNAAMDEDEVTEVITKKKVLRYLRSHKPVPDRPVGQRRAAPARQDAAQPQLTRSPASVTGT